MALRELRITGDPILRKRSREITAIDDRIKELSEDMLEMVKEHDGAGLAAVQVGILRRIIVAIIGGEPRVMLNPEILETKGVQKGFEGCLSVPGKSGEVIRPKGLVVRYKTLEGETEELYLEDFEARTISHEVDHLNGVLYTDKLEGPLYSMDRKKGKK